MSDNKKTLRSLRALKVFVIFGFPLLGALYFYQFTGQKNDRAVPFRTFHVPVSQLETPLGEKVTLTFKEPITIVNFWATWCPPCVEEFPAMIELQRQMEGRGVEILFVSEDDSWEAVQSFMKANRIDVAPRRLFRDADKSIAKLWGSDKFPETYVVRQDGWVVEKIVGAQRWTRPAVVEYFQGLADKFSLKKSL